MDYFTPHERRLQQAFAALRDRLLQPLNVVLTRYGIRPNQISLIGVLFLAGAAITPVQHWGWVLLLLLLYLVCDGIDGPLARYQQRIHRGGAVVDIVADQLGVVFLSASSIFHLHIDGVAALMFATGYISFIALAVYANQAGVTLFPFIRVKYPFYILYVLTLALGLQGVLDALMFGFAVYYWALVLGTTRRIYNHFEG